MSDVLTTGAGAFVLQIPESWTEFDLTGTALAGARAAVLARIQDPRTRAEVNDTFRQAREISRAARKRGALYAAGTATMYDDGLFMGYLMVFAVTAPPGQPLTLSVLSRQLRNSGEGAGRSGGAGRAATEPDDHAVTSVTVPGVGSVARITGTHESMLTKDTSVRMLTMHTVMPLPQEEGQYLIVTCASPNLPMGESVYDLFDAITSTFRFTEAPGAAVQV